MDFNVTYGAPYKAVEKKELGHMTRLYMPRGSQNLAENIIAQFCKFVEPQKKKK